jgi:hypothetical protein
MAKACYKHGLFAIPYLCPSLVFWFCTSARKGGGAEGATTMPLPSCLILYVQEEEGGGGGYDYWKKLENKQKMKHSRFMKWNNCIN